MPTMPPGPWVLVIGCHRSGTSAVTGALAALGLHGVDPADRMDRLDSNPEHWESLAAALFDEDLLTGLGAAWDAPPAAGSGAPVPAVGAPGADGPDPVAIMAAAYPEPGPVVWKDPRACLLLPYWRSVLPGPLTAVFVWREPLAVARSLHTRDGIPLADGLALWEHYNRTAAIGLQGIDTYVLDYASVVEDPKGALGGLSHWLGGIERFAPWADAWDDEAAAQSIDVGLRHQTARQEPEDGTLPDDHRGVADWLVALAGGHRPLDTVPPGPTTVWPEAVLAGRREQARLVRKLDGQSEALHTEFAEVRATIESLLRNREAKLAEARNEAATLGHLLEGERMRYEGVRQELDRMLASTSWKVTRPLRAAIAKLAR
jgi:hypothetical protein